MVTEVTALKFVPLIVIVLPTGNVAHELFNGEKLVTVGTNTHEMLADQPAPVTIKSERKVKDNEPLVALDIIVPGEAVPE